MYILYSCIPYVQLVGGFSDFDFQKNLLSLTVPMSRRILGPTEAS